MIKLNLTEEENELLIEIVTNYRKAMVEAELAEAVLSGDSESSFDEETERIINLSEKIGCNMTETIDKERFNGILELLGGIYGDD